MSSLIELDVIGVGFSGIPLLAKRMRRGGCAIRIDPRSFVGADGVVSLYL
jgi:hypothetical protein